MNNIIVAINPHYNKMIRIIIGNISYASSIARKVHNLLKAKNSKIG